MTLDSDNSIAINNEVYKLAASLKEKQERINLEGRINKMALAISLLSLIVTVIFSYTTNSLIKKKMPK